jgi:hypothetical protein
MPHILYQIPLPPRHPFSRAQKVTISLQHSNCNNEQNYWAYNYKNTEADKRSYNQQSNPSRVYEHILNLSVLSLIPFFFKYAFVELNPLKLDDYKAYVHSQLEEYESNTFRHEFVSWGSEVDRSSPENGEPCDHEYQLC